MAAQARTQVFISYSHADDEWLTRLQVMLRPLTRNHTITVWDDTSIQAGSKWREEIQRAVAMARVAVLLVSPNFLDSHFIVNDELPPLLKAAEAEGLTILWVAVSASMYKHTPIAEYQAANNPATPLDALSPSTLNAELVKIAQKIQDAATRPLALEPEGARASASQQTSKEPLRPKQPFESEVVLIPGGGVLMGSDPQQYEAAMESKGNTGEVESGWRPEAEALLQNWRNWVHAAQSAYSLEATRFKRWHYLLGFWVVVMSTIIGSSAFAEKDGGFGLPAVMIGMMGSLAAIFAALQTFLKLAESAALHGLAAGWYASIRREIEELQALPWNLRGDVRVTLAAIRQNMNKASQNAPQLNEHLWARMAQRFGVNEPPLHDVMRAPRQGTTAGTTGDGR